MENWRTLNNPAFLHHKASTNGLCGHLVKAITHMNEYNIPEPIKTKINKLLEQDPGTIAQIFSSAFVAGMELSMRICRNRAQDYRHMGSTDSLAERAETAETCAAIIRNVQVEIGSGRMPRPTFTEEEMDEMNRIA